MRFLEWYDLRWRMLDAPCWRMVYFGVFDIVGLLEMMLLLCRLVCDGLLKTPGFLCAVYFRLSNKLW